MHAMKIVSLLTLALRTSASAASPGSPLLKRGVQAARSAYDGAPPRRMAYPSVGELLRQPESISEVDVIVSQALHKQCVDILMRNYSKESALVTSLELNLTKWGLQTATTNIDKQQNQISIVLVYVNGSQVVYSEQFTSHSFGCTVADIKYAGIMTSAQSRIDGLNYNAAEDLFTGAPERDIGSFEDYSNAVCDPQFNTSRAFVIYQKGKLVWEKYCTSGVDKDTVQTLDYNGGYSFAAMWPWIRNVEGKFDLDKLSYCPELKQLEKRARNMTARNLLAHRIGRPLEGSPGAEQTKPKALYDTEKMLWAVSDKANYAAMVPSSYGVGSTVPLAWRKQPYGVSQGTNTLLQRELRYTFPEGTDGFAEYASYPWTHLFSQVGARSFTVEADASGTFVGSLGLHANARDFLKLGALLAQRGKWHGKQILPVEIIDRTMNNPFGSDQSFADGGWATFKMADVPPLLYVFGEHGYAIIVPELEIVIFDFQSGYHPQRTSALIFGHMHTFLKKQAVAWTTTTTTTTTSTAITTATSTTPMPSTTMMTASSTSTLGSAPGIGVSVTTSIMANSINGVEQLSIAPRSNSAKWLLLLLLFVVSECVQRAQ